MIVKRLLESLPQISTEDIAKWEKASDSTRNNYLNRILNEYGKPDLQNIKPAIKANFSEFGIDPNKNDFIGLLDRLTFPVTKDLNSYFLQLSKMVVTDSVDLSKDYLAEKSLYDRSLEDFIYTVRLFDTVNQRHKLAKFFKDTTNINEKALYVDGSTTEIKPVHTTDDGLDSLFGTVESWSGEDGKNDSHYDEMEKGGYSLQQALQQQGVPETGTNHIVKQWLNKYFNQAREIYDTIMSDDVSYYNDLLDLILEGKGNVVSSTKLARAKKNTYQTFSDIPPEAKVEGNVVFVNYKNKYNNLKKYMSSQNEFNNFAVYKNGVWTPYKETVNNANIEKARNVLLNQRTIEDKSDKVSIVAGLLKVLDSFDKSDLMSNKRYDLYDYE